MEFGMNVIDKRANPGVVILLGSGETAPTIRKAYDWLFNQIGKPLKISILETPAGFEPNSAHVAGRIADFFTHHLQNYDPQVDVIPARKRQTPFSPNNADILKPLRSSDIIFTGPGSPTYLVRQLQDSMAWQMLAARHYLGTAIILASASTLAFSSYTLPVYEIYKVGEELHWHQGLDFLGPYGLSLSFIPHWNNTEGGDTLDTSRCYMGQQRFEQLLALLPPKQTVVGIDEHTALILNLAEQKCEVMGKGTVTLLTEGKTRTFASEQSFTITELGEFEIPKPQTLIPSAVWQDILATQQAVQNTPSRPSTDVIDLVQKREAARSRKDWQASDRLRDQLADLGWQVQDTPDGPQLQIIP
jgi:hypothetical protein